MRVLAATVRIQLLELLRLPSFTLPLAAFPTILYLAVGAGVEHDRRAVLLGFVAFTILGTMMFQFGVGIAATRDAPWSIYALTIPSAAWQRGLSLLVAGAALATLFCVPLALAGVALGVPPPEAAAWPAIGLALVVGAVVHGLLGIALGSWLPARGAAGIANVVYFPLAFVGGMLGPVSEPVLLAIQPWTPTGAWMRALRAADGGAVDVPGIALLAAFGIAFALAVVLGHRRVERTMHR